MSNLLLKSVTSFLCVSLSLLSTATLATEKDSVCGIFGLEKRLFQDWKDAADSNGRAEELADFTYKPIDNDRWVTEDGVNLEGYKIYKTESENNTRAIYFVQGNLMRVESLFNIMPELAGDQYDVYIFHFRGYGGTQGIPLFKPLAKDTSFVVQQLSSIYSELYVYGVSLGGLFTVGPYMNLALPTAIAIDSTPRKLPWITGCPTEFNPISNLPDNASNILVMSGGNEEVFSPYEVRKFGIEVERRQGRHIHFKDYAHGYNGGLGEAITKIEEVVKFFDSFNRQNRE